MTIDSIIESRYRQLLLDRPGISSDYTSEYTSEYIKVTEVSIQQCADIALDTFRQISNTNVLPGIKGSQLLCERAAYLDLQGPGTVSANGSCRLIKTRSSWVALNMAREEDWELIPAWLQIDRKIIEWKDLVPLIEMGDGDDLVARGRLLGLPVSQYKSVFADDWFTIQSTGKNKNPTAQLPKNPLVIDLSSLWAGPLCTHLLQQAGANVIKVESSSRPDTTRYSTPEFHHLINAGKRSVSLDLNNSTEVSRLKDLLARADIIVESSRPRALKQLGICAEEFVSRVPGLIWLSITGYGRSEPEANWIAFGDDAAIAGGLAIRTNGKLNFVGDAIADPLTGIHAAIAALAKWKSGVASLVDISLSGVASFVSQHVDNIEPLENLSEQRRSGPLLRSAEYPAPDLGADTDAVFEGN